MMRSMYSGVSGLQTHQVKMDVIGNNISNVNTVGYIQMCDGHILCVCTISVQRTHLAG